MAISTNYNQTTFHVGDTIQVHYKLIEKEVVSGKAKREKHEEIRERIQVFQGIVISIRGEGANKTFMVRKIAAGNIGVERIFPLNSPWIKDIKIVKSAKVRRAKLYYLREKGSKEIERLKEKVAKAERVVKEKIIKTKVKPHKKKAQRKKTSKKKTSK